jgi:hypothetical protein
MAEEPQDPNKKQKPLTYAGKQSKSKYYFHSSDKSLHFIALTALAL